MTRDVVRQVLNVMLFAMTVVLNGLANALPLNGLTTGEISDSFRSLFVPAGYTFSIWGVIYVGLLAFTIYQALPQQRENPLLRRLGPWFALSCLANSAWILVWHYQYFELSLILMLVLLVSLIGAYKQLDDDARNRGLTEMWVVRVPFSLYLGWITVATVANATVVLLAVNWSGWGLPAALWAVIMIAIACVIAILITVSHSDIAYGLVPVWAFVGIVVGQAATPMVALAAGIAAAAVTAALLVCIVRRSQRHGKMAAGLP